MNNAMGKINYKAEALSVNSKLSINYSREKYSREKSLFVRGKHCGLPGFGFPWSMQTSQKGFSHTWDWVRMRTIIIVQEVEVHGWLLSGSAEELTIDYTLLLFFDS